MSLCAVCEDRGLVPFVATDNPTPDAKVTAADLLFALCLCRAGGALRFTQNERRRTVPLWRVWCAREQVDPSRVCRLEDVYSAEELASVGFQKATPIDRSSALLNAGRKGTR